LIGIEGIHVKKELLTRSEALPQLYLDMIEAAKSPSMRQATELYEAYYRHHTKESHATLAKLLPSLFRVMDDELPSLEVSLSHTHTLSLSLCVCVCVRACVCVCVRACVCVCVRVSLSLSLSLSVSLSLCLCLPHSSVLEMTPPLISPPPHQK
jgi:hypothetical protein